MIKAFPKMTFIALTAAVLLGTAYVAMAQENAAEVPQPVPLGINTPAANKNAVPTAAAADTPVTDADKPALPAVEGQINPNEMPSVLFTYWEHVAIVDAKRSRGLVRPLTDAELMGALKTRAPSHKVKPPPEEREIKLSGIVFVNNSDWTIWLNGKRVTPKAIPKEVMDLKVYKEYVEMKWIDDYTNQIFPLRLRPHQRFNIDTRIFLPG